MSALGETMTGRSLAADVARVVGLVAAWQVSERWFADSAGVEPLVLTISLYMLLHAVIRGTFELAAGGRGEPGWLLPVTIAGVALLAGVLLMIDRPLWSQRMFSVASGIQAAVSLAMLVAGPRLQQFNPGHDPDAERPRHRAEAARATAMLVMNEAAIAIGGAAIWVAAFALHRTVVRRLAAWLVEAAAPRP